MISMLKKGAIFIILFCLFFSYLLLVSKRIESIENREENVQNVSINYGE